MKALKFFVFLPLLWYMKVYFKILIAVFGTVLCYTILTCVYGKKGLFSQKAISEQITAMKAHVAELQEKEVSLSNKVVNLSYDYDTIITYANELGYIKDGQMMIKLQDMQEHNTHDFSPGQYLTLPEITFMSDRVIKTISISVGIVIILIELIIAYRKQNGEKINYDYSSEQSILFR